MKKQIGNKVVDLQEVKNGNPPIKMWAEGPVKESIMSYTEAIGESSVTVESTYDASKAVDSIIGGWASGKFYDCGVETCIFIGDLAESYSAESTSEQILDVLKTTDTTVNASVESVPLEITREAMKYVIDSEVDASIESEQKETKPEPKLKTMDFFGGATK